MTERRLTAGGLSWRVRQGGPLEGPPVLLLHGFAGLAEAWEAVTQAAPTWRFVAPDLPGHGGTEAPPAAWRLAEAADALVELIAEFWPGPVTVVGYSLGGRLALHLAERHPESVAALALVGVSAGLAEPDARAARREADARWASLLRAQGLEAFFAAWNAQPLFASQAEVPAARQEAWQRLRLAAHTPEGLARAMEAFGLGAQSPQHAALAGLSMPVHFIVGERDTKFAALAAELAPLCPRARVQAVPGAGHNLPLEAPESLAALLMAITPSPAGLGRALTGESA